MGTLWLIARGALRRQWRASLVLALLVAVGAGATLAAAAGARRTSTAFPRLIDDLNPSDLIISPPFEDPLEEDEEEAVAGVPQIAELHRIWGFGLIDQTDEGLPNFEGDQGWFTLGGPDAVFPYRNDQPKLSEGRLPSSDDPNEVIINRFSTTRDGLGVGDTFEAMVFNPVVVAELSEPSSEAEFRRLADRYFTPVDLTVTGVYDRIEEISGQAESAEDGAVIVSPAFVDAHRGRHEPYRILGIDLRDGATAADVQAELRRRLPDQRFESITSTSQISDAVDRSVVPVVGALWMFTVLMGAATLLVAGQAVARSTRLEVAETAPVAALGLTRRDRVVSSLPRAAAIATVGAVVGAAIAFVASPLFPLAPVERADPDIGLRVDWPVLLLGAAATLLAVTARAAVAAWRATASPAEVASERPGAADVLARAGMPATMTAGVRLALRPGAGSATVPASLTVVGAIVAIAAVVGAVGFGASLERFVETPSLYGWTWDAMVFDPPEAGNDPGESLPTDDRIGAVTAVANAVVTVDGEAIFTAGFEPLRGSILPTVTKGRWPATEQEVVLGAKTMDRLDVSVGDSVEGVDVTGQRHSLTVVGRFLVPVVTPDVSSAANVGDGMGMTVDGLRSLAGPVRQSSFFVDFAPGHGIAELRAELGDLVFGPQQPPDVRNYERVELVPLVLAAVIGLLGAAMLAYGLVGAVRGRRRDLAVLKTLGFDRRQVRWTVAWQATTLAVVALVVGVPVGVILGRQAWEVLADRLAVPAGPTIELVVLAIAVVATLALANAAAAIAGIRAGRVRPAAVLRTE